MKTYRKILIALLIALCAISCAFAIACTNTEDPPENKPQRLESPKNLAISINPEYEYEAYVLTWDSVENAVEYTVLVDDQEYTVTKSEYDLSYLTQAATYEISVCAVGDGKNYTNSEYAKTTYTVVSLEQLAMPQNLKIEYDVLSWDSVENASEYKVLIEDQEFTVTECSFDLEFLTEPDTYNIYVCAIGDGTNYTNSDYAQIAHIVYAINPALMFTLNEDRTSYSVATSNTEISGDIFVPSTYNGRPVTSIASRAFERCASLTKVVIQQGIKEIGDRAFAWCVLLNKIDIPQSVVTIGGSAFDRCESLNEINIPQSVVNIGGHAFIGTAFYNDENNWEDGVLYLDNCLISAKTDISGSYSIKQGTRLIAERAFFKCSALTEVIIPQSVTKLSGHIFTLCSSLVSLSIPESVTQIAEYAFYGCASLSSIKLPQGISKLAEGIFEGCTQLTTITLPESVTQIDKRAFYGCTALTTITVPESVTQIAEYTFYGCTALTTITLPKNLMHVGAYAFRGCASLSAITLPENVTLIDTRAFYNCTALTSLTIHKNIMLIANYAIGNCSMLTTINFDGTMVQWLAISKLNNWYSNATGDFTVICTDGKLDKLGNVVE